MTKAMDAVKAEYEKAGVVIAVCRKWQRQSRCASHSVDGGTLLDPGSTGARERSAGALKRS